MRRSTLGLALTFFLVGAGSLWWWLIGRPVVGPRPVPAGALHVAVFGDSLTTGFGANRPAVEGIIPLLAQRIERRRPGSTVRNVGVGGSTIRQIDPNQLDRIPSGSANFVLVVSGGNDMNRGALPWTVARDEARLLDRLRERYPRASLWVTDLPDVSTRQVMPLWSRPIFGTYIELDNAVFDRVAPAHGAHVLPLGAISRRPEANQAPYVARDGLHPSTLGYARLADELWPQIAAAL